MYQYCCYTFPKYTPAAFNLFLVLIVSGGRGFILREAFLFRCLTFLLERVPLLIECFLIAVTKIWPFSSCC